MTELQDTDTITAKEDMRHQELSLMDYRNENDMTVLENSLAAKPSTLLLCEPAITFLSIYLN